MNPQKRLMLKAIIYAVGGIGSAVWLYSIDWRIGLAVTLMIFFNNLDIKLQVKHGFWKITK